MKSIKAVCHTKVSEFRILFIRFLKKASRKLRQTVAWKLRSLKISKKLKALFFIIAFLSSVSVAAQGKFEVFFDFNEDVPNAESKIHLQNWIDANKNVDVIKVFGYCDSVDINDYNKKLAGRRINSVLGILKDNKISIDQNVELNPLGEDFQQSKIQSENRKVAVFYTEAKKPEPKSKTVEILSEQIKKAKPGDLIKLQNINFFNNSDKIVPKSKPVLEDLLCIMRENPKLKIEIQGHICCQLERDSNGISTARARAVEVFLIRNKIAKNRLSSKGFGITKPIHPIPEQNEDEEDENRRVEILIVEN
jgi:outer membrane protein OmpA-like peptidoglycan-associated protein